MPRTTHAERHRTDRIGWLRAAVLGANDGIVSTASLVVGVAAAGASQHSILVTGVAGLVAGAMSMAAGEYVSVHSQADTEQADLSREQLELRTSPVAEQRELAAIYVARGLEPDLAQQVAAQLMAHDALGAHARDELGIFSATRARPVQAALASAASFRLRCRAAAGGDGTRALADAIAWPDRLGLGDIACLPRRAGVRLGARRRRQRSDGCRASYFLGRAGAGDHRWRGRNVRHCGVARRPISRGQGEHHHTQAIRRFGTGRSRWPVDPVCPFKRHRPRKLRGRRRANLALGSAGGS